MLRIMLEGPGPCTIFCVTLRSFNEGTQAVEENIISGNLISDVSDHFAQFCISQSPISKEKPPRLLSRDFSNFTERNFINDLLLIFFYYGIIHITTKNCFW